MTERALKDVLVSLSGFDDFTVRIVYSSNKQVYAYYYVDKKIIEIYAFDEDKQLSDEELIKSGLHELTHHVLINHYDLRDEEEYHNIVFKKLFAIYLKVYYNGQVPENTIRELRREGLYVST